MSPTLAVRLDHVAPIYAKARAGRSRLHMGEVEDFHALERPAAWPKGRFVAWAIRTGSFGRGPCADLPQVSPQVHGRFLVLNFTTLPEDFFAAGF